MLKIVVELIPGGFEQQRRTIGVMAISNESDLADASDYRVDVMESFNPLSGDPARIGECMVKGHDRRQSVWLLLEKACREIVKADLVDL